MENSIFGYIWRYSRKQQITIMLMTASSLPFLYLVLDLPKYIINDAIDGTAFPKKYMGFEFEQVEYLMLLCAALLVLLVINALFSMSINTYKGVSSERLIRRLRYQLYENILRFPPRHFQKVTPPELSSMITAEVEPLGNFISDSFSMPMVQGGTMLTILFFMVVEDPLLGLVAISMVPVQAWLIPKLQFKVTALGRRRIIKARKLAGWVGESVLGVSDIHTNDASTYMQASISKKLGRIFAIRHELYQKKFFMKALNVFLSQLTPLFFYSIGGILTIKGDLSLGALVAVLAAYNRFTTPWKELLKYYQTLNDVRIKYEQLVEQFQPGAMMDLTRLQQRPETIPRLNAPLSIRNVGFVDESVKLLEDVTVQIESGEKIAVVSEPGTRDKFARLIARLLEPTSGTISVGETNLAEFPESVTGAVIGYAGPESYIFSGTLEDNILFGVKHTPLANGEETGEPGSYYEEAMASGNSTHEIDAEWINYDSLGLSNEAELKDWVLKVIHAVELDSFLSARSLTMELDAGKNPDLAEEIKKASQRLAARFREDPESAGLVRPYKFDEYNASASVAANLVFGEPIHEEFEFKTLGGNPIVRVVLEESDLTDRFVRIGHELAETLIELFGDMSSDQPLFDKYSFVDEETLDELKLLTTNVNRDGLEILKEDDRTLLTSLTMQLVVDRHRFGFIDDELQERILKARRNFRGSLPKEKHEAIAFYDQEKFNSQLTNRCNLLMGGVNHTLSNAEERINKIILDVLEQLQITDKMILHATECPVGVGGSRLSHAGRQKVALARSLIKRPDILVFNDALGSLDRDSQTRIRRKMFDLLPGTTFIVFFSEMPGAGEFKQILSMQNGRIAERYIDDRKEEVTPVSAAGKEAKRVGEEEDASPKMVSAEASALSNIPIFSALSQSHLKLLAFSSRRIDFAPGEELIREGEPGKYAFVVLDGEVDIVLGTGKKEKIITQIGKHELLGELSLLTQSLTTATVRAAKPVTALRIEKEVFIQLMEGDGRVASQVARWVSDKLVSSMKLISKAT